MKKLKVAVVFGGRSGEHEVSLVSASSVIKALDPEKYNVFEIGITKEGHWLSGPNCLGNFKKGNYADLSPVNFDTNPSPKHKPDIAFPVLHGPFGEDGTIQGLFEMLKIPYVGCGVLASSTAMSIRALCFRVSIPFLSAYNITIVFCFSRIAPVEFSVNN